MTFDSRTFSQTVYRQAVDVTDYVRSAFARPAPPIDAFAARPQSLSHDELSSLASSVAEDHRQRIVGLGSGGLRLRHRNNCRALRRNQMSLVSAAKDKELLPPGSEWFLDNFYILENQFEQIRKDYTFGYGRTLPKLSGGSFMDVPRVYSLAFDFLRYTDCVVNEQPLIAYVKGYNSVDPLRIGELWAIPIMLRIALIENLRILSDRIVRGYRAQHLVSTILPGATGDNREVSATKLLNSITGALGEFESGNFMKIAAPLIRRLKELGPHAALSLTWTEERLREEDREPDEVLRTEQYLLASDNTTIGHAILSLRQVSYIDWKSWFEKVSPVDEVLAKDPSGLYTRGDFATRDYYRRRVERYARLAKREENAVAAHAVQLAAEASHDAPAFERHIGYYLIDAGTAKLAEKLDFTPGPWLTLRKHVGSRAAYYYITSIVAITFLLDMVLTGALLYHGAALEAAIGAFVLMLIPISDFALCVVQWLVTQLTSPRSIPRLELEDSIPPEHRTLVCVHAIFQESLGVTRTLSTVETRYLANDDDSLLYVILADLPDSALEIDPRDDDIKTTALEGVAALNAAYGEGKFICLFRSRRWNPAQNCYLAWERKRGKLEEFNRLLRGDKSTSFIVDDEEFAALQGFKYVITLDNDSQLPHGVAKKLIGTVAHPLNRPIFNDETNVVERGYSIIQPRMAISITSGNASLFSRTFAGHAGLDPYTKLVSDVYQDLFGEASYIGKGIYDIDAFHRALHGRVPENALLSHDLFESCFARCGLASDIELFDDFPARYHSYMRRQHRWVRGDWQLLPFLFRNIPNSARALYKNPLSLLGQWKLFDNLRRSIVPPATLAALLWGWVTLPMHALTWMLLVFSTASFPFIVSVLQGLIPPKKISLSSHVKSLGMEIWKILTQICFTVIFLPHMAWVNLDAFIRTCFRVFISHKKLLEWETAYHAERRLGLSLSNFVMETRPAVIISALFLILLLVHDAPLILPVVPLFATWLLSPVIAWLISKPLSRGPYFLLPEDKTYLQDLAFDTWMYFDTFLTEERGYLIPDNVDVGKDLKIAERTSPTNIAYAITAITSAYDLGFLPLPAALEKIHKVLKTLTRLEKFRGHLLNWYDLRTLAPLEPRYVSFVDSGNLLAVLLVLTQTLDEYSHAPVVSKMHVKSLQRLLNRAIAEISDGTQQVEFQDIVQALALIPDDATEGARLDLLHPHCAKIVALSGAANRDSAIGRMSRAAKAILETPKEYLHVEDVESPQSPRTTVISECRDITAQLTAAMDFQYLYDKSKDLFVIGHHLDGSSADANAYDFLASEARLGSFAAVALGLAPVRHWFALGRSLTNSEGGLTLVSWGGTMFEYLMPTLFMKTFRESLLFQAIITMIQTQQRYAQRRGVPWGMSESAYSGVDVEGTFQYRAFGVPSLGLKRGLEQDVVVSPYSTCMALPFATQDSLTNLRRLEGFGARCNFGFYEAIDFTKERLTADERYFLVSSVFAHHQGMSLLAFTNMLTNNIAIRRFHSHPQIRSAELVLQERFPTRAAVTGMMARSPLMLQGTADASAEPLVQVYTLDDLGFPRTHILSNGRMTTIIDQHGSGWTYYDRDTALTRWKEDSVTNGLGTYIYIRDTEANVLWSTSVQPTKVTPEIYEVRFIPGKAEFRRRDHGIVSYMEIAMSPDEQAEVRKVSLTNVSSETRKIELTSFAEVALASKRGDSSHPAFSKLFVQSEYNPDLKAVIMTRRPRAAQDQHLVLLHMVTCESGAIGEVSFETSRAEFVGRNRTYDSPLRLCGEKQLAGKTGTVLDPVMSVGATVELAPGESTTFSFVTIATYSMDEAVTLAQRYQNPQHAHRAFELAINQGSIELRTEGLSVKQLRAIQRLANALIFNSELARAPEAVLERNRLGQSALWRFGISGDYPIVLAMLSERAHVPLFRDLLQAHYYLRGRGLPFDLVVVNESEQGYFQPLQEELDLVVRTSLSHAFIDKPGGIFLRHRDQFAENEMVLLQSSARVVLLGARGLLSRQLRSERRMSEPLLAYEATKERRSSSLVPVDTKSLKFFNGWGGFSAEGDEYQTIVRPEHATPLPWANIVAHEKFGFLVTESGGGYTWAENARELRLSPWSNDPVQDPQGEVAFIQNTNSGEFWSLTPQPAGAPVQYLCSHRWGQSNFTHTHDDCEITLEMSILALEPVKWMRTIIKNTGKEAKDFRLVFYIDWVMGVNREETYRYLATSFDEASECLCVTNWYNADLKEHVGFLGATMPLESYTSDREEFIGFLGSLKAPRALMPKKGSGIADADFFTRRLGAGFDSCGAVSVRIQVEPGETAEMSWFLGATPGLKGVRRLAGDIRSKRPIQIARSSLRSIDVPLLEQIRVQTPDDAFNILMNGWLLNQTLSSRLRGRTGFYQSSGAFGFRDQLQDSLALLWTNPELTRRQILLHASRQFREGDVQHWWHPPSGKGIRTKMSDGLLWLPYAVARYVEVTGDRAILDEQVSFLDGPLLNEHEHEVYFEPATLHEETSLLDHCIRAVEHAWKLGEHSLPLMGCGDWNDGMNLIGVKGRGESVWLAWFYITVLKSLGKIVEEARMYDRAQEYSRRAELLRAAIEEHAWDGAWYRRAFFDNGMPLGSSVNTECRIDSIAQSWSVISGAGSKERMKEAMESLYANLVDKDLKIVKLLTPAFDVAEPHPGYIRGYPPGIRENGAQYTHASTWAILAFAMLGDGNRAHELFSYLNPILHTDNEKGARGYQTEPYALCGDVYSSPEHPGKGGWSWYTGAAGWLYQVGLGHILGLQLHGQTLKINPCIPAKWQSSKIEWRLKDRTFVITIENPDGAQSGVRTIEADGRLIPDKVIRLDEFSEGSTVEIRVRMGG